MTKVVSISGTRHNPRKKLPRAADLATLLRSGDTCDGIADTYRCSARTVAQRLNEAGYNATTGEKWEERPAPAVVDDSTPAFHPKAQALCAGVGSDAWFPEKGQGGDATTRTAKAICARCPALQECLEHALEHEPLWGIWAGTTPQERRRRKNGEEAVRVCAYDGCGNDLTGRTDRRYCSEKCKAAVEYQRRLQRQQEAS